MSHADTLGQSLALPCGITLKNRFAKSAMCEALGTIDNHVTPALERLYGRWAQGGTGLLITGNIMIDRNHTGEPRNVVLEDERDMTLLKRWADAGKSQGNDIWVQLNHPGKQIPRMLASGDTLAPSAVPFGKELKSAFKTPRALSEDEIFDIIRRFATSSALAKKAGFTGVQIHGAHGYLIDQFFWDVMNKRDDKFGGTSLVDRASFASDILKEIRKRVSPDFPIILRYSQWKQQQYDARLATTPEDLEAFLKVFVDGGVDVLHASQRRYWEPEFPEVDGENGLNGAGWAKKLTGLPTITVGSVGLSGDFIKAFQGEGSGTRSLDDLEERLSRGEFDLVAVGRALLQDPAWARKVHEGRLDELNDYDAASLATLS